MVNPHPRLDIKKEPSIADGALSEILSKMVERAARLAHFALPNFCTLIANKIPEILGIPDPPLRPPESPREWAIRSSDDTYKRTY